VNRCICSAVQVFAVRAHALERDRGMGDHGGGDPQRHRHARGRGRAVTGGQADENGRVDLLASVAAFECRADEHAVHPLPEDRLTGRGAAPGLSAWPVRSGRSGERGSRGMHCTRMNGRRVWGQETRSAARTVAILAMSIGLSGEKEEL